MAKVEKIDSFYSRGWRGAAWMKRTTAKLIRRKTRFELRRGNYEEEISPTKLKHVTRGWTS